MTQRRGPLAPGERAPDFALPRQGAGRARFYGHVGGAPALLVLTGDGTRGDPAPLLAALHAALDGVTEIHTVAGPGVEVPGAFADPEGQLHRAYGMDPATGPWVHVLDPNVRVIETIREADPERAASAAHALVAGLDTPDDTGLAARHAPVLLVPNALDDTLCDELIERCATHGSYETGVETSSGGKRVEEADRRRKRRLDHAVEDPELLRRLTSEVGRRVLPELAKAFAYRATRFEGFKIGCYHEDQQGFFEAHRDNLSAATAHRRFALSLNLNQDYEGGELRFPEYGPARYRPDRGEALVFSGSHLHEVLPVTRGQRYVLVSFLYGEEAVRRPG
jgi:predicted 2-oxoglutarate/Fe(II)-dependent dioxygenase YbiX